MPSHPYLNEFDIDIIRALSSELLLLPAKQIYSLFPDRSPRNIRYRLHRLVLQDYLAIRHFPSNFDLPKLPLYFTGPNATEALSLEPSEVFLKHRKRAIYMKDRAIPHFLLIQSVHLKFITETRPSASCSLATWIQPYDPLWITFKDYGLGFRPDAYAEIQTHGVTIPFFLEIDTGEERGKVLRDKFDLYRDYARSGNFRHHFSLPLFRLLFITTSYRRIRRLLRLTPNDTHLFWFAPMDAFLAKPLLEPHWSVSGSDIPQSLSAPP